jgi:hypothetical protein
MEAERPEDFFLGRVDADSSAFEVTEFKMIPLVDWCYWKLQKNVCVSLEIAHSSCCCHVEGLAGLPARERALLGASLFNLRAPEWLRAA